MVEIIETDQKAKYEILSKIDVSEHIEKKANVQIPIIDSSKCTGCMACSNFCAYNAAFLF